MKHFLFSSCMLFPLLGFSSCVDKNYDFTNMSGDNLQLFDNIALPLGRTGQLTLSGYFEDITEIRLNEDGEYFAAYSDTLQVALPKSENLDIMPIVARSIRPIPFMNVTDLTLSAALDYSDDFTELFLPQATDGETVKQIQVIEFDTEGTNSRFTISTHLSGIKIKDQKYSKASIRLIAQLPDGSLIVPMGTSQTDLRCPLAQGDSFSASYSLNTLNCLQGGKIRFYITLIIPPGETVTIIDPKIEVCAMLENPEVAALTGQLNFSSELRHNIDISSFFGFIRDDPDNNLGIALPQLNIRTKATHGVPLSVTGCINNEKNSKTITSLPVNFKIDKINDGHMLLPQWFVFADNEPVQQFAAQWIPLQLCSLINPLPHDISLDFDITPIAGVPHRVSKNSTMQLIYELEMPLAFTDAVHLSICDTIFSVLDADIREKLFASGEAEIYGTITTTLPIDITFEIVPVDRTFAPLDVLFDLQRVAASPNGQVCEREFKLLVRGEDFRKMRDAEHFIVLFRISSELKNERILKGSDYIQAKLNVRKKGGIAL